MNTTLLIVNLVIAIAIILVTIMVFHLNATISLVIASLYMGVSSGLGWLDTINTIGSGFGNTMSSMGISIIFGVIIGEMLSKSGGANVIAETLVRIFPEKKALYAIAVLSEFWVYVEKAGIKYLLFLRINASQKGVFVI